MTDYEETLERALRRYGADSPEVRALIDERPAPATCILTGETGEDPDDCTTHEHETA